MTTLLFDLDGTLIDSERPAEKAIIGYFDRFGVKLDPSDSSQVIGKKWEVAFDWIFGKYSIPVSENISRKQAEVEIIALYRELMESQFPEIPGSREAVQRLASQYRLALVSGSPRKDIEFALDRMNLKSCFQFFLGAEDYPLSKPSPDGYRKAIQALGVSPMECLVLEDSNAGIESGLAAGCWVGAVTYCQHASPEQIQKTHLTIEDWSFVTKDWIQNQLLRWSPVSGKSSK